MYYSILEAKTSPFREDERNEIHDLSPSNPDQNIVMLSVITSSVQRCTLNYFRVSRGRDFVSKFIGHRMIGTAVLSSHCNLNQINAAKNESNSNSVKQNYGWDDEIPNRDAAWREVVREITERGPYQIFPDAMKYLTGVLDYSVPGGTSTRYLSLMHAYKSIVPADQITEKNLHLARILGWCCELYIGGSEIYDDVIDNADTRRGRPCWYKKTGNVKNAGVYCMVVSYLSLELIRRHFQGHSCYKELFETFQQCILKSHISWITSDVATNFGKKPYLDNFTMGLYQNWTIYRGAFTIMLPIQLAIYHAGIKDPETLRQAELISLELGRIYIIKNDYYDSYGDFNLKSETDIASGEMSWLIVEALRRVTPEQRTILDECYGEKDPEKVAKVKQLYDDLEMPKAYAYCEDQSYNLVTYYIEQLSCGLPRDIFFSLRDNIYGTNSKRPHITK